MDAHTHLEDLSNEIFVELFDYFHALDIFTSFSLLNRRISFILQSILLRIVISKTHCRRQIDFLSSHLTSHDHQVISIKTNDTIRDESSIISLLFNRHNFINLKSCLFYPINSSTRLNNVIKQIKNLDQLVSFTIYQNNKNLDENYTYELTQTLLMHKSSSIRSVVLQYPYNYSDMSRYTSIPLNLISLKLWISGSTVSVYSILSVLRLWHTIRHLHIVLQHTGYLLENNNTNDLMKPSSMNDNDLPMLSQMISCEIGILDAWCDSHLIRYILRCMPNLKHFYFHLTIQNSTAPFSDELLDGYVWQQMFVDYVPYLSKFEFHMSILKTLPKLNLDIIVNSFECLVGRYSNWHMVIDRWTYDSKHQEEYVMLSTLNYHKYRSMIAVRPPCIDYKSFDTRSTTSTADDHYSFYCHLMILEIGAEKKIRTVNWSSPLFQHITNLLVKMPVYSSWWSNLFHIVNFGETINDHDDEDAQQTVTCLSHIVSLHNVIKLEFQSTFHISLWKDVQYILQACPNVTELVINTQLLFLSKIIDNSFLTPTFNRIKNIKLITEEVYFPWNFAFKFVQRFSSLTDIILRVFSFDHCVYIIDIFLIQLEYLSYLRMSYHQDTLLDNPFSCDYITTKRRQSFPMSIFDEQMINVKNNGEIIEIWLS